MQKTSGVRAKGTFQGLAEKIPYWKELGITSLELMPSYDFEEYPSKTGEKDDGMGMIKRYGIRKKNLITEGYTKGNYFARRHLTVRVISRRRELKAFFSASSEAGIEYLMDFYFPVGDGSTDGVGSTAVLCGWNTGWMVCPDG